MRTLKVWTIFIVFGILDCVADNPLEPINITTESRNFSLFLTWLPAPKNPPDVTYVVNYMLDYGKSWRVVPKCKGTFATECDLTCVLQQNYSNQHTVRVRAVSLSKRNSSSWVYLYNITYMFTVDPSPPILQIIQGEGTMIINTSVQTPLCMPQILHMYLTYLLEIRNVNNPAERIRQIELTRSSQTLKTDGYEGEYCMAAKTNYKIVKKISRPSHSICFNFTQKDQSFHLPPLAGLLVMVFIIVSIVFGCFVCYKTNQKATFPEVLDFSHKRYALAVSVIPEETLYPVTINKNLDQTSSATFLLSSEDSDSITEYPLNGCGYTERKTLHGNNLRRDSHYGASTSDEYMSSKDLPTNFSSDKSSDSSCIQTSGSSTEMTLMLNNIQLHNQSEEIIANVSGNMETLVTNTITMGPLLETLRVSDCSGFGNVHLNTIAIATDQCSDHESYDYHLTDSEDNSRQLTNNCTNCDTPESYIGSQTLQTNWSHGYEQRGYTSR